MLVDVTDSGFACTIEEDARNLLWAVLVSSTRSRNFRRYLRFVYIADAGLVNSA